MDAGVGDELLGVVHGPVDEPFALQAVVCPPLVGEDDGAQSDVVLDERQQVHLASPLDDVVEDGVRTLEDAEDPGTSCVVILWLRLRLLRLHLFLLPLPLMPIYA